MKYLFTLKYIDIYTKKCYEKRNFCNCFEDLLHLLDNFEYSESGGYYHLNSINIKRLD